MIRRDSVTVWVKCQGFKRSAREFYSRASHWRAPKREKQLSTATTPPCFWFFRCRVDVYFKKELKHSKRFVHVTDDVMSLFWSWKNFQVEHYLPANFLCRVIKGWLSTALGLVSRLSLMFITPLHFKCRTSTGYFSMPHKTKTWNMLFVFNSLMNSCHSNKKTNSEIVTWLMTPLP